MSRCLFWFWPAMALLALSPACKRVPRGVPVQSAPGDSSELKPSSADRRAVPAAPAARPSPPPPRRVVPAPVAKDAPTVRMTVLPESELVLARTAGVLNLILRLEAARRPAKRARPPVDLAIVLDRSGSMQGKKIERVKKAAIALLERLGPRDRVTLISYAGDVKVHLRRMRVDDRGMSRLAREVRRFEALGSTALGPALSRALSILERTERGQNRLAHVMLLSDGRANVGESRPDRLGARAAKAFRRGVSVSTLGVGLDFNDRLMIALATQGGGRYHFIEHAEAIPTVLRKELAGLEAAVARQLVLRLSLSQGVSVRRCYGYATSPMEGGLRVRVGALRSGQTRNLVLSLNVPATHHSALAVGSFHLAYRDVRRNGVLTRLKASLSMRTSTSRRGVARSIRPDVAARVSEAESAHDLSRATSAFGSGSYDRAGRILDGTVRRLERRYRSAPSPKLHKTIRRFKRTRRSLGAARRARPRARARFMKRNNQRAWDAFMQ